MAPQEHLPGFDPNRVGTPKAWPAEETKDGNLLLPGPKAKQAEQLFRSVQWMATPAQELGLGCYNRLGFLTLTMGDYVKDLAGERFQKVYDREEAERRMNSLLTNVIRPRYQCGVIVRERHKDKAIHYHLIVVCAEDIRTAADGSPSLDFEACFKRGDYSTANAAIKTEWRFWREHAAAYGFGRANLQPVRRNGEAAARYMAKYITKTWLARDPADKGARVVRYFGRWTNFQPPPAKELPADRRQLYYRKDGSLKAQAGPFSCRFGWLRPQAKAWREACKQMAIITKYYDEPITEENVKERAGRHWSFRFTKLFRGMKLQTGDWQDKETREGIDRHNLDIEERLTFPLPGGPCKCWRQMAYTRPEDWMLDDRTDFDAEAMANHRWRAKCARESFHFDEQQDFAEVIETFPEFYGQGDDGPTVLETAGNCWQVPPALTNDCPL